MNELYVQSYGWFVLNGQRIIGTVVANFNGYLTIESAVDFTKRYDIRAETFHPIAHMASA